MQTRDVTVCEDGGTYVLRVPLGPDSGYVADLEPKDFDLILSLGFTGNVSYFLTRHGKVYPTLLTSKKRGGHIVLARLLMDAKDNERISYRDKNSCNLRRDNLVRITRKKNNGTRSRFES